MIDKTNQVLLLTLYQITLNLTSHEASQKAICEQFINNDIKSRI